MLELKTARQAIHDAYAIHLRGHGDDFGEPKVQCGGKGADGVIMDICVAARVISVVEAMPDLGRSFCKVMYSPVFTDVDWERVQSQAFTEPKATDCMRRRLFGLRELAMLQHKHQNQEPLKPKAICDLYRANLAAKLGAGLTEREVNRVIRKAGLWVDCGNWHRDYAGHWEQMRTDMGGMDKRYLGRVGDLVEDREVA